MSSLIKNESWGIEDDQIDAVFIHLPFPLLCDIVALSRSLRTAVSKEQKCLVSGRRKHR